MAVEAPGSDDVAARLLATCMPSPSLPPETPAETAAAAAGAAEVGTSGAGAVEPGSQQGGTPQPPQQHAPAAVAARLQQQQLQPQQQSGPVSQQQRLQQQYLAAELQVAAACASNSSLVSALNNMRDITFRAIAANEALQAPHQQQQQEQPQQQQQQQQLQDYLQCELGVASHCASQPGLIRALNAMRAITLQALTRAGAGL